MYAYFLHEVENIEAIHPITYTPPPIYRLFTPPSGFVWVRAKARIRGKSV